MTKEKITVIIPIGSGRKMFALKSIKNQSEKVVFLIERGQNTSSNRNRGIKKAKTEIVAFINAHSILPNDWSKKIRNFFEKHPDIDLVGGPQLTAKEGTSFEKISGYALGSKFGSANVTSRYKTNKFIKDADETLLTTANLACRKKVFEKIKFDENLYPGEDPKFISDAKSSGFNVSYNPKIFVYHKRRKNIKDLTKQIFFYGYARPKKESLLKTFSMPSFLIPSLFVIYLVFLPIFSYLTFFYLVPLGIYLFLNLGFSFFHGLKNKNFQVAFVLPIIFFSIHFAYGLGFILGTLTKKIN